jgi:hypothetical protein
VFGLEIEVYSSENHRKTSINDGFSVVRLISFDYRRVNSQGNFTCPWGKKSIAIPYFQDHHVIQYHGDIGRVL